MTEDDETHRSRTHDNGEIVQRQLCRLAQEQVYVSRDLSEKRIPWTVCFSWEWSETSGRLATGYTFQTARDQRSKTS